MTAARRTSTIAIAERHNPRRAFLLVSRVLGKHVPVDGRACRAAGLGLAFEIAGLDPQAHRDVIAALARGTDVSSPAALTGTTVIGFAETATGLGEQVAHGLDADWFQTTTRQVGALTEPRSVHEAHSHAPDQWIERVPAASERLVIVDDELTTGATAANLIAALHAEYPRKNYTVAALVDARQPGPGALDDLADRLGVEIRVAALERAPDASGHGAGWSGGALPATAAPPAGASERVAAHDLFLGFSGPLQHVGQGRAARHALAAAAREAAARVGALPADSLVLATGEHMAFAQHFAAAAGLPMSSSTRSPVLVATGDGYPIRDGLAFANPDGPGIAGYAYNVRPAERPHVVVHFQDRAHRARGDELLAALAGAGAPSITTVTLAP